MTKPERVDKTSMKKKYELTNAPMFLCKVPSAWQRGMKPKIIQDMEDGNSRNGYHKVKCQVPETEELQRREKGGENKWTINQ